MFHIKTTDQCSKTGGGGGAGHHTAGHDVVLVEQRWSDCLQRGDTRRYKARAAPLILVPFQPSGEPAWRQSLDVLGVIDYTAMRLIWMFSDMRLIKSRIPSDESKSSG